MIGAFYSYGKDYFASAEFLWEGIFALIASVIITVMGAALLRVNKLQDKWRVKLERALAEKHSRHSKTGANYGYSNTSCLCCRSSQCSVKVSRL